VLVATDDAKSPPASESTDAKATPEVSEVEPATETAQAQESPMTDGKGGTWKIISVLIGLGIVAAGFAIYKKTV
jgi:hypothetical protein